MTRSRPAAKELASLRGKVAIANAKLAYQRYKRLFAGPRWEKLKRRGARTQRLLWASTGTKNKEYSDVLYVDGLIADDTVNTLPPSTMDAFRDHGKLGDSLEQNIDEAKQRDGEAGASRHLDRRGDADSWWRRASSFLPMPSTSFSAPWPRSAQLFWAKARRADLQAAGRPRRGRQGNAGGMARRWKSS